MKRVGLWRIGLRVVRGKAFGINDLDLYVLWNATRDGDDAFLFYVALSFDRLPLCLQLASVSCNSTSSADLQQCRASSQQSFSH